MGELVAGGKLPEAQTRRMWKGQLHTGSSLPEDVAITVTAIASNSSSSLFRVEAQRAAIKMQVLFCRAT